MKIYILLLVSLSLASNAVALTKTEKLTHAIDEAAKYRWSVDCDDYSLSEVKFKYNFAAYMKAKLPYLVSFNDSFYDHIIKILNDRYLDIRCDLKEKIQKDEKFLEYEKEKNKQGLHTGALYEPISYKFDNNLNIFRGYGSAVIYLQKDIFSSFANMKFLNNNLVFFKTLNNLYLEKMNNLLHEFFHFLQLDNNRTSIHNALKPIFFNQLDAVYACTEMMGDSQISHYVKSNLKWIVDNRDLIKEHKTTADMIFDAGKNMYYSNKYEACITCSTMKKVNPFSSDQETMAKYYYGYLPNFTQSRLNLETQNKCIEFAELRTKDL